MFLKNYTHQYSHGFDIEKRYFVQKMIYRVEEFIAGSESFQIIYFLLWVFLNRLEGYVPQIELKDKENTLYYLGSFLRG